MAGFRDEDAWLTTVGGNLTVSQGNGINDQVNFTENFGTVDSTSTLSFVTTVGGNVVVPVVGVTV